MYSRLDILKNMTVKDSALKRTVSTRMLALYGIGNIVGAGVYVLIGKIAEPAGYLSIVAFAIAALVAFCSALSYAELAARFPVSAGVAVYLHEAFRAKRLSTIIGLALVVAGVVSSATLIKGFAGYFHALVPLHPALIMVSITILLVAVCLKGIKESVGAAALFTVIEILGLIFLIGSIFISQPDGFGSFAHNFEHAFETIDTAALMGVLSATFIAFYAFVGFEDMVNIAEEVKEPQKAFPRAIIASMFFVTVLYTLVAIATLSVLTPQVLGDSSAPLAKAYEVATKNDASIIILISLVATLNGILANVIMGSRFLYGLGRRRWIPTWFSHVSERHVPDKSLLIVACAALIGALLLPIEHLAQLTSLLLLCVFLAVNISLAIIRRHDTNISRHLQISPNYLPWIGIIASGALLLGQCFVFFLS